MIVVLTETAEQDLEAIGDHIARDAPRHAIAFLNELRKRCISLAELPHRFPLIPRHERQGVRRCVHGRYLILYRVDHDQVTILRILHGAMDYTALLFPS